MILLLAIPVNLVFTFRKENVWRGRVVVSWLFGLAHTTIRAGRDRRGRRLKRRPSLRKSIVLIGRQLVKRRRHLFSILRSEGFIQQVIFLVRNLLRTIRPRRLRLQCVIGLDEPADTGRLMGVLAPLRVLMGKMSIGQDSNVAIQVNPDFSGPRFEGYCCASVQFVPLKLIVVFLGFLFSPAVFRAIKMLIQRSNA